MCVLQHPHQRPPRLDQIRLHPADPMRTRWGIGPWRGVFPPSSQGVGRATRR
jgi:hypothetical protein